MYIINQTSGCAIASRGYVFEGKRRAFEKSSICKLIFLQKNLANR